MNHSDSFYNSLQMTCASKCFWLQVNHTNSSYNSLQKTCTPTCAWGHKMNHTESANNSLEQTYESNVLAITCELR